MQLREAHRLQDKARQSCDSHAALLDKAEVALRSAQEEVESQRKWLQIRDTELAENEERVRQAKQECERTQTVPVGYVPPTDADAVLHQLAPAQATTLELDGLYGAVRNIAA